MVSHPPGLLQVRLQPLLLLFEIDSGNGVGDGVKRQRNRATSKYRANVPA